MRQIKQSQKPLVLYPVPRQAAQPSCKHAGSMGGGGIFAGAAMLLRVDRAQACGPAGQPCHDTGVPISVPGTTAGPCLRAQCVVRGARRSSNPAAGSHARYLSYLMPMHSVLYSTPEIAPTALRRIQADSCRSHYIILVSLFSVHLLGVTSPIRFVDYITEISSLRLSLTRKPGSWAHKKPVMNLWMICRN